MIYFITYGCGCGEEYEVIEAPNEADALYAARSRAIDNYQSYEGYHGVLDRFDVAEEYDLKDEDDIEDAYWGEIECSIRYETVLFDENDEEHLDVLKVQGRVYNA